MFASGGARRQRIDAIEKHVTRTVLEKVYTALPVTKPIAHPAAAGITNDRRQPANAPCRNDELGNEEGGRVGISEGVREGSPPAPEIECGERGENQK